MYLRIKKNHRKALFNVTIVFTILTVNPIIMGSNLSFTEERIENIDDNYHTYIPEYKSINSIACSSRIQNKIITTSGLMNSSWPMKCHDVRHTSQSPYNTADNHGVEKWRFRTEDLGAIESSPVVDSSGIIYFGTMGSDSVNLKK